MVVTELIGKTTLLTDDGDDRHAALRTSALSLDRLRRPQLLQLAHAVHGLLHANDLDGAILPTATTKTKIRKGGGGARLPTRTHGDRRRDMRRWPEKAGWDRMEHQK